MHYELIPTAPASVPDEHPLRDMFRRLVGSTFETSLGMPEQPVIQYVADMLTDFTHTDCVYRIRNRSGRPLEEVADMILEGDVRFEAGSFDRERYVHKHVGDFTLFWAGIYPEALRRKSVRQERDGLLDFVRQGKQSYHIVSTFRHGDYAKEAALFQQLSDRFELCQIGLGLVRREWERLASLPRCL